MAIIKAGFRPTRPPSFRGMSTTSDTRPSPAPGLTLVVADPEPWYAATPTSDEDRRRELEDAHTRLLARAVGDRLPYELALRAAELVAQLERTA